MQNESIDPNIHTLADKKDSILLAIARSYLYHAETNILWTINAFACYHAIDQANWFNEYTKKFNEYIGVLNGFRSILLTKEPYVLGLLSDINEETIKILVYDVIEDLDLMKEFNQFTIDFDLIKPIYDRKEDIVNRIIHNIDRFKGFCKGITYLNKTNF